MPGSMEKSNLYVEGRDDKNSLVHLLIHHGIDYDTKPWPAEFPKLHVMHGVEEMLKGMQEAIRLSSGRVVGFVPDADSPLLDRWQAVRDRLRAVDVDTPNQPLSEGFIGESPTYKAGVGIWLMPDNQHDGKLETFLRTLIDEPDPLIGHATSATDTAKQLGAKFTPLNQGKAILHAWLAWQEEPGLPYGTAIRARYFGHDSGVAKAFVAWFKRLYRIS